MLRTQGIREGICVFAVSAVLLPRWLKALAQNADSRSQIVPARTIAARAIGVVATAAGGAIAACLPVVQIQCAACCALASLVAGFSGAARIDILHLILIASADGANCNRASAFFNGHCCASTDSDNRVALPLPAERQSSLQSFRNIMQSTPDASRSPPQLRTKVHPPVLCLGKL